MTAAVKVERKADMWAVWTAKYWAGRKAAWRVVQMVDTMAECLEIMLADQKVARWVELKDK